MTGRARILALLGLQALSLGAIAIATFPTVFHFHALDLLIYRESSLALLQGQWPSVDGQMVYPPLALIPFLLPHLVALLAGHTLDLVAYARLWPLVSISLSVAVSLLVLRFPSPAPSLHSGNRLFLYTLFVILGGPILLWRYDLFPTLLTFAAALALWRERPFIAGLLLGAGIAAKLYPALFLPVFCLYALARGAKGQIPRTLLGTAITALIPFLPFAISRPGLISAFLTYHSGRGLEIESLYAGWIALLHHLGLAEARPVLRYGTWDIASPIAAPILQWQPFIFALIYGGSLVDAWRKFRQAHTSEPIPSDLLMTILLNVLLVFILTGKVFSPQYIIWLLPFGTFLKARYLPLLFSVLFLTLVDFPFLFDSLTLLELVPVLIVNLRNLAAVLLMVGLIIDRPGSPR